MNFPFTVAIRSFHSRYIREKRVYFSSYIYNRYFQVWDLFICLKKRENQNQNQKENILKVVILDSIESRSIHIDINKQVQRHKFQCLINFNMVYIWIWISVKIYGISKLAIYGIKERISIHIILYTQHMKWNETIIEKREKEKKKQESHHHHHTSHNPFQIMFKKPLFFEFM